MSSIRDVARLAGVSPATVSRILNKQMDYNTSPETRERVLRAVTELNYKPLASVKNEREKSGISIGCLLTATQGKYSDPYYLDILNGIEAETEKLGGTVTFVQTDYHLEDPRVLNRLRASNLDGLVLMRWLSEEPFERLRSVVPHIVGIDTGHMPIDNIEYDHRRVSTMAVEYLYSRGYRQIGFIGSGTGEYEGYDYFDIEVQSNCITRCSLFSKDTAYDAGTAIANGDIRYVVDPNKQTQPDGPGGEQKDPDAGGEDNENNNP